MSKGDQEEKSGEDEKDLRKHEEKSVEEKWRRDRLGSIVWALILIWAGFVLLAGNMGLLDAFNGLVERLGFQWAELPIEIPFFQVSTWSLIFLGAGVLLLAEAVVRLLFPAYRRPVLGTVILAVVFLGIGFGNWGLIWPLVLIVIGIAILFGGLFRRK